MKHAGGSGGPVDHNQVNFITLGEKRRWIWVKQQEGQPASDQIGAISAVSNYLTFQAIPGWACTGSSVPQLLHGPVTAVAQRHPWCTWVARMGCNVGCTTVSSNDRGEAPRGDEPFTVTCSVPACRPCNQAFQHQTISTDTWHAIRYTWLLLVAASQDAQGLCISALAIGNEEDSGVAKLSTPGFLSCGMTPCMSIGGG